jgi:methyl-accepting chemotaxis protein
MKAPKKFVRRKLLIDPSFQLYFLAYSVGIAVIVSAIFFIANRLLFQSFLTQGRALGLPPEHMFFRFILEQRAVLDLTLIGTSLIVIFLLIAYGLYLSNRVAGPIYRLKNSLKAYTASGKFSPVKFRKRDFFQDLATSVNDAILHSEKSAHSDQ